MRRFIAYFLVVSFFCLPVYAAKTKIDKATEKAAENIVATDPDAVPILQKIKGNKKDLSYDYLGNRFGVDAWLLSGPDVMQIVYTMKDMNGAMLGGALVGPDGKEVSSDLTKEFMTQYPERAQEILATVRKQLPVDQNGKPTTTGSSPSEMLWQKLQQGGRISFGNDKAPALFAILDPVQPASKEVWAKLSPLAKTDKINLNILPLGMTTADSIMEIASVLGDKDPKAAWENLMQGHSAIKQETPDSSGVLGMKANVDLAQSLHLRNVPFLVYRDKTGKIRIIQGLPKDWDSLIKELNAL